MFIYSFLLIINLILDVYYLSVGTVASHLHRFFLIFSQPQT